jgi:hypothetical protein
MFSIVNINLVQATGFWWADIQRWRRRASAGAEGHAALVATCGTAEAMPCYKAYEHPLLAEHG